MRFSEGERPKWKGKPKKSRLDDDPDFQKLITKITNGSMNLHDEATLYVDAFEDGQRLGTKSPARMVRDNVNRILVKHQLDSDFDVTCRQTDEPNVWAVWIVRSSVRSS